MQNYRVFFYKDLLNSDGHNFKCLQRQVDVQSDDPSQALELAGRLVDNERMNADCVEVMHLTGHHEFEPPCEPVVCALQTHMDPRFVTRRGGNAAGVKEVHDHLCFVERWSGA